LRRLAFFVCTAEEYPWSRRGGTVTNERDPVGDKIRLKERPKEDQYFAAQDRELIAKLHGVWLDHAALMALAKRDTGAWVASFLDGLVRVVTHPKD